MNKIKLLLASLLFSISLFSQTGPPAPSPGIWAIIDTNYTVGSSLVGVTKAKITLKNTTVSKTTGTQFRVYYDKVAFTAATVSLTGTPSNLYMQYVDNNVGGYITITLVYTGSSAVYTLPDGEMFDVTFTHLTPVIAFQNLVSISNLTWVGIPSFTQTATEQAGNDIGLSLHNYGGNFIKPGIKFHGTFTNTNSTPSKSLTIVLAKKLKASTTWTTAGIYTTNSLGKYSINQNIDTTLYNIRLEVRGDTMGVGNVISTADAQYLNSIVTTSTTPQGFDYYTGDVNGSNDITISDVYGIFGRISGRFSTWPSSVPDIKFFTVPEYTTIIGAPSTNYTSLIPGVTNFTYNILPGTPDSANFYVMVPGDVNGTGYHMARLTPIRINNPSNAPYHIIDETVEYDGVAQTIEIRLPELTVNEGNLVEVPVKVFTGANKLGALQLALKFDSDLLDFRRLTNGGKSMNWMSFINPQDGVIEWGGFDMTNGNNLLVDGETVFTFNFIAKAPQNTWNESPLYTTRKFVGDENAKDMNIIPTNGLVAINRMGPGIKLKNNDMLVFPNPTTGEVIIQFNVEQDGDVDLSFVDGVGNNVINVLNRYLPNGTYSYTANLKDLSAGTYYTVLKTLTNTVTNKTILIK